MEIQEVISVVAQILGFLFILGLGIIQVYHMNKSGGSLTPNETAKIVILSMFVLVVVINGFRDIGTDAKFDTTMVTLLLGAVLGMAGIDAYKVTKEKK